MVVVLEAVVHVCHQDLKFCPYWGILLRDIKKWVEVSQLTYRITWTRMIYRTLKSDKRRKEMEQSDVCAGQR
jgi:hypothetical protein